MRCTNDHDLRTHLSSPEGALSQITGNPLNTAFIPNIASIIHVSLGFVAYSDDNQPGAPTSTSNDQPTSASRASKVCTS